eukprot:CAMPEP_0114352936 /NCGR_PEP_ID=MMETSP0101-20121206/18304_1 /TAXON_ID=38822 ORGANISM="Pteridomonas danica, Strain PT" /NCGR_SAMPLE_ID=MMETSP0101 /ASSEMBLY_ACC=CAM_ASM_000211 /LENGTH=287 /DNA_ID=CAMNT_0001493555 /DNA_START=275 /DNA_END=1139 /DNA_ORIENTATION=-
MDEEVRQTLNSSGLDKFVPQIASLGIETMVDLTNPFLVTDEQLRKIGMTTRHIERFRSHATPLPRVISCEEDVENVSLPEVEVRAPPVPSFVPLLSDLGLEEYEKPLRNLCRTESSRALLLKASEKDICGLGVPLVKARKLLDKIRSNEADALVEGTRYRAGRRVSGKSVDGILVDLGISHFQDNILATAGGLDVYDILRVTELELVERCGLPRLQARKLRRRVLQTTHENKGGPGSEDLSAPFDKSLRAATSFNEVQSVGGDPLELKGVSSDQKVIMSTLNNPQEM